MSHRSRVSFTARLSGYAAIAIAAGAASTASAGVVIVNLAPGVGVGTKIDLGPAVGAGVVLFSGVILSAGAGAYAGGSSASNGSQFFIGKWFGTNAVISNGAAGGTWAYGGLIGNLADGATAYFGFRLPSGSNKVYGWIEATRVAGTGLQISRWAYESTPNTGILTPTATAIPGGAGLAALAIGAAGLRGRRRSRN